MPSTPSSTRSPPLRRCRMLLAIWRSMSGLALPCLRSPVFDMIDVRLATRVGCSMAMVCAIIPPIEMPTTWARSMPRWSSSPMPSWAMSLSRYAGLAKRRDSTAATCRRTEGAGASMWVDRPASRLS